MITETSSSLLVAVLLHWHVISLCKITAPSDTEKKRISRARVQFVYVSTSKAKPPSAACPSTNTKDKGIAENSKWGSHGTSS
ncbi:hypothetical protein F4604DRAFT_89890 [Suillus subluteus]|nr:hypothetical protein F4604DRAFT_89890 [Suillus subluteus]